MLSKPIRKRRHHSCRDSIREDEDYFCAYCYGLVTFIVYDDTSEQRENAIRYVKRELEESCICAKEEDMWISVWHHEDDCLFITLRLYNYEGKTFLGWTPEAEEVHLRKVVLKRSNRIEINN